MTKPFIEIDANDFRLFPFTVLPTEGYTVPIDEKTKAQFPFCCPYHINIFENAIKWYEKFPNCCPAHREMAAKWWFNKEEYRGVPLKIVTQISYSCYLITMKHDKEDWYDQITDYIEYNAWSFGQPAIGLHYYFTDLKEWFKSKEVKSAIAKEKIKILLGYIDNYYVPKTDSQSGFNEMYNVYEKWLEIFPFDLSYFQNLKDFYQKQFPILNGVPKLNSYLGISSVKTHNKESLIDSLVDLTNNLLTQINGASFFEKGLITDANKLKIELVINSRKLKLKEGYKVSWQNEEVRYKKILNEWFEDEKKFMEEIAPLINGSEIKINDSISIKLKEILTEHGFATLPSTKKLSTSALENLIELIVSNKLPFVIAMFDFLGFFDHLQKEYFQTKYLLNKEIAKWLNTGERTVKGNISSLLKNTTENKERYTAHLYKEDVKIAYQKLK